MLKVNNQKHKLSIFHLDNNLNSTLIYTQSSQVHNKARILKRKFMIRWLFVVCKYYYC